MADHEIDLSEDGTKDMAVAADELMDAIDLASDQGQVTWVLSDGKRIAAIVPVDVAEAVSKTLSEVEAALNHVTDRAVLAEELRRLATMVEHATPAP